MNLMTNFFQMFRRSGVVGVIEVRRFDIDSPQSQCHETFKVTYFDCKISF